MEENPYHGNTLNLIGVIAIKERAFQKACDLIQEAMKCYPEKAPIFGYNLALAYSCMGNQSAAVTVYKKGAEEFLKREERKEAFNSLEKAAVLLRQHGDLNEAKKIYLKILEIDPQMISAYNDLGLIFYLEANYEEALRCFNYILQIDSTYSTAYNNLGLVFLSQKKFKECILVLEQCIELDPECTEAQINLGTAYLEEEKFEQAQKQFENVLNSNPSHSVAHNNLGIALHRQGKFEAAISSYKKAIELDPSYEEAKMHLNIATQDLDILNSIQDLS